MRGRTVEVARRREFNKATREKRRWKNTLPPLASNLLCARMLRGVDPRHTYHLASGDRTALTICPILFLIHVSVILFDRGSGKDRIRGRRKYFLDTLQDGISESCNGQLS